MSWLAKGIAYVPYILITVFLSLIIAKTYHRPVYQWDEAIYANNSLEMASNNHYFVYFNNDTIDHYNTKPPLVLWLQASSFKVFGYTEAALRLPTYLALLGTLILLIYYSRRLFGNNHYGLLAGMLMLISPDVIRHHVFLSGDLDGVLVFFTSFILLHHLKLIATSQVTRRDYLILFLLFTLGFLTKSTAILLLIPGLFLSFLINKQLRDVVNNRYFLWLSLSFIGIISAYYFIREQVDPGYFAVVWYSEFSRIYQSVMSWQEHPFKFYFENLYERFIKPLFVLIVPAIAAYILNSNRKHSKILLHGVLLCLAYLLAISYPAVKMDYYVAPIYPLLCLALSILLLNLFEMISTRIRVSPVLVTALILLPLFVYRVTVLKKEVESQLNFIEPQEKEAMFLKTLGQKHPQINQFKVLMDVEDNKLNHFDALNFYRKAFQLQHGKKVEVYRYVTQVRPSDSIIVTQRNKIDSLANDYHLQAIDSLNDSYFVVVRQK